MILSHTTAQSPRTETDPDIIAVLQRKGWKETAPPAYDPATQAAPAWDGSKWTAARTLTATEIAAASGNVGKLVLWGGTNTLPPYATRDVFTPGTSGLIEAGFVKGTSTTADLLLVYNSTLGGGVGGWDQYFFSSGGLVGIGWRKVGGGSANQADTLILPGSVLQIKRVGTTPVVLLWKMP